VPDLPPWFFEPKGRYDEHVYASEVLKGNPLGDPYRRPLWVYLPPGYDVDPQRRYPSIYVIMSLTGQIDMWRNRPAFRRNFPELADAHFAAGGAKPCILIYVDCWTSLGGSQYVDSPGTGKYHTYLCDEIVPWVDARYRTLPQARHRGIIGKSSGRIWRHDHADAAAGSFRGPGDARRRRPLRDVIRARVSEVGSNTA
jgi:enterochelin esterase-like enzyme